MTMVNGTCANCGEFSVEPAQVVVVVVPNAPQFTSYKTTCPLCECAIQKPVAVHIVRLLAAAGARIVQDRWPAEVLEWKPQPALSSSEAADLILDFHERDFLVLALAAEDPEAYNRYVAADN